jgi:hypothetical protein
MLKCNGVMIERFVENYICSSRCYEQTSKDERVLKHRMIQQ